MEFDEDEYKATQDLHYKGSKGDVRVMSDWIIVIFYAVVVISTILFCIFVTILDYSNTDKQIIIVADKYVKGEAGTYFIIDENKNAYIIKDLLFKGKFNSTDLYNQIEIGTKYKIETTGYRIHFLSKYKNINSIEKIDK